MKNPQKTAPLRQNLPLYGAVAVFAIVLTALSPVVAELEKTAQPGAAGKLFVFNFTGFVLFSLISGELAERLGKKNVISAALIGYVILLPVFALADSFMLRYIVALLLGACGGIVECVVCAFVADLNPAEPDKYVNYSQIGFGFGAIASPLLVSVFIQWGIGFKAYYLMLSVLVLALLVWLAATKYPSPQKISREKIKVLQGMKDRRFLLAALALFLYTSGEIASWGWLSSILQNRHSLTVIQAGAAVSIFWASMTAGRFLCGALIPRFTIPRVVGVFSLLCVAATVLMIFVGNIYSIYGVSMMLGFSCSSIFPFLTSYGSRYTNLPSGFSFSLLIVSANIGGAILPYLIGVVRGSFGPDIAAAVVAVLFLSTALCMVFAGREERKAAGK